MDENSTYEIEAIVSFDDRGQLVIPKDLRKKFNLKSGDKFALISCVQGSNCCDASSDCCDTSEKSVSDTASNDVCCFTLINTKQLKGMVSAALGPMMSNMGKAAT